MSRWRRRGLGKLDDQDTTDGGDAWIATAVADPFDPMADPFADFVAPDASDAGDTGSDTGDDPVPMGFDLNGNTYDGDGVIIPDVVLSPTDVDAAIAGGAVPIDDGGDDQGDVGDDGSDGADGDLPSIDAVSAGDDGGDDTGAVDLGDDPAGDGTDDEPVAVAVDANGTVYDGTGAVIPDIVVSASDTSDVIDTGVAVDWDAGNAPVPGEDSWAEDEPVYLPIDIASPPAPPAFTFPGFIASDDPSMDEPPPPPPMMFDEPPEPMDDGPEMYITPPPPPPVMGDDEPPEPMDTGDPPVYIQPPPPAPPPADDEPPEPPDVPADLPGIAAIDADGMVYDETGAVIPDVIVSPADLSWLSYLIPSIDEFSAADGVDQGEDDPGAVELLSDAAAGDSPADEPVAVAVDANGTVYDGTGAVIPDVTLSASDTGDVIDTGAPIDDAGDGASAPDGPDDGDLPSIDAFSAADGMDQGDDPGAVELPDAASSDGPADEPVAVAVDANGTAYDGTGAVIPDVTLSASDTGDVIDTGAPIDDAGDGASAPDGPDDGDLPSIDAFSAADGMDHGDDPGAVDQDDDPAADGTDDEPVAVAADANGTVYDGTGAVIPDVTLSAGDTNAVILNAGDSSDGGHGGGVIPVQPFGPSSGVLVPVDTGSSVTVRSANAGLSKTVPLVVGTILGVAGIVELMRKPAGGTKR